MDTSDLLQFGLPALAGLVALLTRHWWWPGPEGGTVIAA